MPNAEKLEENLVEELEKLPEQEAEEQIVEGEVDDVLNWEKLLPEGIKEDMINSYMTTKGKHHWTLRPDLIKDKAEQERINSDMELWGANKTAR